MTMKQIILYKDSDSLNVDGEPIKLYYTGDERNPYSIDPKDAKMYRIRNWVEWVIKILKIIVTFGLKYKQQTIK